MKFGGKCYCHACHTRFAIFFLLPSCCVSSLMSACKAIAKLGEFQTDMRFVMFASWATISYRRVWQVIATSFYCEKSHYLACCIQFLSLELFDFPEISCLKNSSRCYNVKFFFIFRFYYYSISFLIAPINHSALLQLSLFLFSSLMFSLKFSNKLHFSFIFQFTPVLVFLLFDFYR